MVKIIFDKLISVLGIETNIFIPLMLLLSSLVFFGKNFVLGGIILFVSQTIGFLICYIFGYPTDFSIKMLILSFLILVIILLINIKNNQEI